MTWQLIDRLHAFGRWLKRWGAWLAVPFVGAIALILRHREETEDTQPSGNRKRLAEEMRPKLAEHAEADLEQSRRELTDAHLRHAEAKRVRDEVLSASDEDLLKRSRAWEARKRGPLLVLLAALALAAPAQAQDAQSDIDVLVHPTTGEPGFWLAPWAWREALADSEALPLCQAAAAKATSAAELAQHAAEDRRIALALEEMARAEAEARAGEAEAKLLVWYRQPGFLVASGVVLGTLVTGVGALAVMR